MKKTCPCVPARRWRGLGFGSPSAISRGDGAPPGATWLSSLSGLPLATAADGERIALRRSTDAACQRLYPKGQSRREPQRANTCRDMRHIFAAASFGVGTVLPGAGSERKASLIRADWLLVQRQLPIGQFHFRREVFQCRYGRVAEQRCFELPQLFECVSSLERPFA